MPTYKNITGVSKTIGDICIKPNDIGQTQIWSDDPGLQLIDELPLYNPVIISTNVTQDFVVELPIREKRLSIHIYVEGGRPEIRLSSDRNDPPLNLYPSARWNMRVYDGVVRDLRIKFVDKHNFPNSSVWVNVERI